MDEPKQPTIFDTDQQQVGEAYANALVGFGQENGQTEELLDQLGGVVTALNDVPKLQSMLELPGIASADKLSMLDKAFNGKVDGKLLNFLKIVLDKRRFDCLGAIHAAAKRIFDEQSGRVMATMTTAEKVEDSVRVKVEKALSDKLGKQVQLQAKIDASVIGGMVIRVGDTVYDSSVASQLKQVRGKAIKGASDAIRSSLEKFMAS